LIINNSSIRMDSKRVYTSVSTDAFMHSRSTNVISEKAFAKNLEDTYNNNTTVETTKNKTVDTTGEKEKAEKENSNSLSGETESTLEYLMSKFNQIRTSKAAETTKQEEDYRSAIRYMCFNLLLILLFGKNGGEKLEDMLGLGNSESSGLYGDDGLSQLGSLSGGGLEFVEVTDSLQYTHYEAEFEGTIYSAKGIVKTSDGKEIDINIDLTMSRSLERMTRETDTLTSFQARLCDPLVINLDMPAAEVSDQKFYFDLDADGTEDAVSMLSARSGFLALDLNEDGVINDGSELFGTKSGDGFADLAKYDSDGNGWIDEADEIFDKLKIFCVNKDGTTSQYSIKDKGVGAICLGSKETEFSVTNPDNMLNAQIRKTGIFLYETGSVGTIQHVDLNVELGA